MNGLPAPLPWQDAQRRLLAQAEPLGPELVPVAQASGRYLAAPLSARRHQPAADLSAMDGYAVRSDDLTGPWQVVGESAAGHPLAGHLQPGQAIRISTGAVLPAGEMAVLLQEDAARDGAALSLTGTGAPEARHIRRRGFDFATGDRLLEAGQLLTPAALALAGMAGHAAVSVGRQPRVAVIDSGDELAPLGSDLPAHRIPASNGAMLGALVAPFASMVDLLGPVPDQLDRMVSAFEAADGCDVIVTSGGASVGDHDLLRPALAQWGATVDFWRIALKPGKPLLLARRGRQFIVGLPGNPVSSYVTAFLFVLPLLRKLAGSSRPEPVCRPARLAKALPATGARAEFLRAMSESDGVVPLDEQDSSALRSLARASCLILRPPGSPAAKAGDTVPIYLLQNGGIA